MREPLDKGYLTQTFHKDHLAFDIGWISDIGKNKLPPLYAVDDGEIAVSGFSNSTGAGYFVGLFIPSGNPNYKYLAHYAHNAKNAVKTGDKVKKGQVIAYGGNTGNSSGEHVHFEIWKVPIDFKFNGYGYASDRKKYAIPPSDLINFKGIRGNGKATIYGYDETPLTNTKAVALSEKLNMRDYPSTKAFSAGYMPNELKAVAITTKVHGYEWVKCEYNDRYVYVAKDYVELKGACDPIIIEKEVIKEVIKEVDRPFKEVFERNGITVTIERK